MSLFMDPVLVIVQSFWIIIPVYVANASAVIVGGGTPIDFHKNWRDNRRLLGDGKTWRGLLSGTFLGMTAGFGLTVAASYLSESEYAFIGVTNFEGFPFMILLLFSLCFGALLGDIIESFFKRRVGKDRGQDWIPFDQIDFLLGAFLFNALMSFFLQITGLTTTNWFTTNLTLWHILFLLVVTPFIHFLTNFLFKRSKQHPVTTLKK